MTAPALVAFGQGQGAVSADNLNTFIQSCDTFSQLRGLVGTPGLQVYARGQSAVADGLQRSFYWDQNSTATDDNLTVLQPTGGAYMGRWIALPQSGGGSPGGSTTQIQYNSAGSFAGASGITTTGTELAIAPAANAVPLTVSGYSVTGSGTASMINTSGTLNTTGTVDVDFQNITNTASNASSTLVRRQVGGVDKFKVSIAGEVDGTGFYYINGAGTGVGLTATTMLFQVGSFSTWMSIDNLGSIKIPGGAGLTVTGVGYLGFGTGSGGTVTQLTSRTTGVTLNKPTGQITLVSAAGLATYQSFTLTNSAIGANDVVVFNQKSGTDLYIITVTNVAAGSCKVSFATTGGVTVEQPVFSFAVIRGASA